MLYTYNIIKFVFCCQENILYPLLPFYISCERTFLCILYRAAKAKLNLKNEKFRFVHQMNVLFSLFE